MDPLEFIKQCSDLEEGQTLCFESIDFISIFSLKNTREWWKFNIETYSHKDIQMSVWNQKHPVEENITKHTTKAGIKLRVWMVSRFGDVGVTDNLINPIGYDARGFDPSDFYNWEITRNLVIS